MGYSRNPRAALLIGGEIATQFDKGTLTLDQQIAKLQRGVEVPRVCHRAVMAYDSRVKELVVEKDGQVTLRLFEPHEAV